MIKITKSSGNVFKDLGASAEEAEQKRIRAELMLAIERHIHTNNLTQGQAAKLFGVTQPRISDLMRGKFHLFSTDALIAMLAHAGLKVKVQVLKQAA